jgi:CubicO group peptidase (beta-lactamase class C family)
MLLAEEGRIDIEKRISSYLPNLPTTWSNVTVRHLLTHTSGIKDFINEPTVNLTNDVTPDEIVKSLESLPLNFRPGEDYRYSNTGYQLLGMIIHRLTGVQWHEFVRQRVLVPAGMTSTRVNALDIQCQDLARGYRWEKEQIRPGYPVAMSILSYPGGGLLSSVVDLAAWDKALYSETVLKRSLLEKMWTPVRWNNGNRADYGFGWGVEERRGRRVVSHGGAHMTGFTSTFMHFVDDKVSVIVLCNQRAANPADIAFRVAGSYIPGLLLSSMSESTDPKPSRSRKLSDTLRELSRGELPETLTPQFREAYRKDSSRAKTLATRLSEAKGLVYLGSDNVAGRGVERYGAPVSTICYYKMPLKDGDRFYTFYLTSEERLASYQSSEF